MRDWNNESKEDILILFKLKDNAIKKNESTIPENAVKELIR